MQSGLANLANQRLIAHAHQMFPLAKVAVKAFTTGEMRIVSLIDERMSSSASCAISGSGKRGCACIPAPTRRAKRPSIRGSTTPSPTTTPNRSWRSRIIVVHLG